MSQIDAYESTRLSLLDVAMDRLRIGNKKGMIHRIFISSKLVGGLEKKDKKSLGSSIDKFLKHCQSQLSQEPPSGILLMYNQHALFCLESSQEIIMLFMQEINTNLSEIVLESIVLSFTENIQTRLFQHGWADAALPIRPLEQKHETSDSISQVIINMIKQTVSLSEYVNHNVPKVNYRARCETMISSQTQLIVSEEIIEHISNDKSLFSTIDYVKKYTKPLDVVLDQELIWPLEIRLFPYM